MKVLSISEPGQDVRQEGESVIEGLLAAKVIPKLT